MWRRNGGSEMGLKSWCSRIHSWSRRVNIWFNCQTKQYIILLPTLVLSYFYVVVLSNRFFKPLEHCKWASVDTNNARVASFLHVCILRYYVYSNGNDLYKISFKDFHIGARPKIGSGLLCAPILFYIRRFRQGRKDWRLFEINIESGYAK